MKEIKINTITKESRPVSSDYKVIEWNISDQPDNLYAVVTPVKNKV